MAAAFLSVCVLKQRCMLLVDARIMHLRHLSEEAALRRSREWWSGDLRQEPAEKSRRFSSCGVAAYERYNRPQQVELSHAAVDDPCSSLWCVQAGQNAEPGPPIG